MGYLGDDVAAHKPVANVHGSEGRAGTCAADAGNRRGVTGRQKGPVFTWCTGMFCSECLSGLICIV